MAAISISVESINFGGFCLAIERESIYVSKRKNLKCGGASMLNTEQMQNIVEPFTENELISDHSVE